MGGLHERDGADAGGDEVAGDVLRRGFKSQAG